MQRDLKLVKRLVGFEIRCKVTIITDSFTKAVSECYKEKAKILYTEPKLDLQSLIVIRSHLQSLFVTRSHLQSGSQSLVGTCNRLQSLVVTCSHSQSLVVTCSQLADQITLKKLLSFFVNFGYGHFLFQVNVLFRSSNFT